MRWVVEVVRGGERARCGVAWGLAVIASMSSVSGLGADEKTARELPLSMECPRRPFEATSGSYQQAFGHQSPREFRATTWWDDYGETTCTIIERAFEPAERKRQKWVVVIKGQGKAVRYPDGTVEREEISGPFSWGGWTCAALDWDHRVGEARPLGLPASEFAVVGTDKRMQLLQVWGGIPMRTRLISTDGALISTSEVKRVVIGEDQEPGECVELRPVLPEKAPSKNKFNPEKKPAKAGNEKLRSVSP